MVNHFLGDLSWYCNLLFESSDEGTINGLGIVKGQINKIPVISDQRTPHVGWCELIPTSTNSLLKRG